MHSILIFDTLCPAPYDTESIHNQIHGGTEAIVLKIVEKLSIHTPIVVAQHNRKIPLQMGNITFAPISNDLMNTSWRAIIALRNPNVALKLSYIHTDIPIFVWLHDLVHIYQLSLLKPIIQQNIGIIVMSDFQRQLLLELFQKDPNLPDYANIHRIYNPIDDALQPDNTPVDPFKLVFASSPNKGLEHTLNVFEEIQTRHPEFKLMISNPGYLKAPSFNIPNAHYLGTLKHEDNIQLLRSALCLFALNPVYPETFGLVYAEANAVGTPVLTHPLGAAPELLSQNPEQLINTYDVKAVEERLLEWSHGKRPKVLCSNDFRLSTVIKQWEDLLFNSK